MTLRHAVAVSFLAAQVVLVVAAQIDGRKSFAWAPHTTQIAYTIDATVNGRPLTPADVRRRYGLSDFGWEVHSLDNLQEIVRQHARTYGRHDTVKVIVWYRINGRAPETWEWQSAGVSAGAPGR